MDINEDESIISNFKSKPLEKRMAWSSKLLATYPGKYPIIVQRDPAGKLELARQKFIVSGDSSVLSFTTEVRNYIRELKPTETIYCFLDHGVTPLASSTISSIYAQAKDEDGFLYLTFTVENALG